MGIASVLFRYGSKALKLAPEAILGTGTEVAGKAMRKTSGSIFAKAEAGVRALEKDVAKNQLKAAFSLVYGKMQNLLFLMYFIVDQKPEFVQQKLQERILF